MSTRKLKRNISNDPSNDSTLTKKHKTRKPIAYETPHPTALSQSVVYKLPSSVGEPASPSDFSPIPKPKMRKTSSKNLKENAGANESPFKKEKFNRKKYGKAASRNTRSAALESPFAPSSPQPPSPDIRDAEERRVLTSKVFNPNATQIPQSPVKTRRPSAPTPPRKSEWNYVPSVNASATDLTYAGDSDGAQKEDNNNNNLFAFQRSPSQTIDFNRPPSTLSMYDYNRSLTFDNEDLDSSPQKQDSAVLFAGIRDESTPFKLPSLFHPASQTRRPSLGSSTASFGTTRNVVSDTDTDSDSCGGWDSDEDGSDKTRTMKDSIFDSLKLASRSRASSNGSGYVTPSAEDSEDDEDDVRPPRSPWVEDSLISAPDTRDWKLFPRNAGYMRDGAPEKDVEMADGDIPDSMLEDIFDSLIIIPPYTDTEKPANTRLLPAAENHPPHATILRTRSLGDSEDLPSNHASTAGQGPTAIVPPARRTRSGTVVQAAVPALAPALPVISGVFRRTRSGTVVSGKVDTSKPSADAAASNSSTATVSNGPPRRTRSGTVVLAKAASGVSETSGAPPLASAFGTRRARSGSVQVAPALSSVGEGVPAPPGGSNPPPAPVTTRRSRSGSIAALANTVGAKLASLPLPGTGMLARARSGTVVRAPVLPPAAGTPAASASQNGEGDTDVVMDAGDCETMSPLGDSRIAFSSGPGSSPDPLALLASSDIPSSTGNREARRTSSRVGGSGHGKRKGKAKLRAANAMEVDGDDESDDELLLKPGDKSV